MMWILLFLQPTYQGDQVVSEKTIEIRRFYGATAEADCKKVEVTVRHLCAGPIDAKARIDGWMHLEAGRGKQGNGGPMTLLPGPPPQP